MSLIFFITPLKKADYNILRGIWVGNYMNGKVVLNIDKGTCSLEFKKIKLNRSETITGNCNIDYTKTPNTFIIDNISGVNLSLYSLILIINENLIHITNFSTKWKLRPINFTKKNTIILKKHNLLKGV